MIKLLILFGAFYFFLRGIMQVFTGGGEKKEPEIKKGPGKARRGGTSISEEDIVDARYREIDPEEPEDPSARDRGEAP